MKTLPVNCSQCEIEFQKPVSYIKQGQQRGYPNHFCSNKCNLLFNKNRHQEIKNQRIKDYYKNPKLCLNCNSPIDYREKTRQIYCSSRCAAIFTQKNGGHCHWSEEGKRKQSEIFKKLYPRAKRLCKNCNGKFECSPSFKTKCCSKKCSNEWIKNTGYLKGKCGGYRIKGGRGKQGWYKGYYCNSSWELAWLIFQLEHNVIVERNNTGFEYIFEGRNRKYYPDFILPDKTYIEIKGYHSKQVDAKTSQFPHKLQVLHKTDLKEIFEYVEQKYGKDYIRLYEKSA